MTCCDSSTFAVEVNKQQHQLITHDNKKTSAFVTMAKEDDDVDDNSDEVDTDDEGHTDFRKNNNDSCTATRSRTETVSILSDISMAIQVGTIFLLITLYIWSCESY